MSAQYLGHGAAKKKDPELVVAGWRRKGKTFRMGCESSIKQGVEKHLTRFELRRNGIWTISAEQNFKKLTAQLPDAGLEDLFDEVDRVGHGKTTKGTNTVSYAKFGEVKIQLDIEREPFLFVSFDRQLPFPNIVPRYSRLDHRTRFWHTDEGRLYEQEYWCECNKEKLKIHGAMYINGRQVKRYSTIDTEGDLMQAISQAWGYGIGNTMSRPQRVLEHDEPVTSQVLYKARKMSIPNQTAGPLFLAVQFEHYQFSE